jgi:hypothetical protein
MGHEMKKFAVLLVIALGGCSVSAQQATVASKAVIAGNSAGAAVAGIVNPAVAVPATGLAAIGDGLACALSATVGGTC